MPVDNSSRCISLMRCRRIADSICGPHWVIAAGYSSLSQPVGRTVNPAVSSRGIADDAQGSGWTHTAHSSSLWRQVGRALSIFANSDRTPRPLSTDPANFHRPLAQKALGSSRTCFQSSSKFRSRNDFLSSRNGGEGCLLILLLPLKQQAGLGYSCRRATWETFIPGSIVCWIM